MKFLGNIYINSKKNIGDLLGICQLKLGLTPTSIKTPRMALEQWKSLVRKNQVSQGKSIAIIAFRNWTWVEWAVFTAHYVFNMGYQPIILYSQQEIDKLYTKNRILEKIGFNFWDEVLKLKYIKKINFDEYFHNADLQENAYQKFAEDFAPTTAAYNLRVEEFEEHVCVGEYQKEVECCKKTLVQYGLAMERIIRQYDFFRLICPSGLISQSAAIHEAARRCNLETVFVEGWAMRPGHMIWALNRPALIYDIKGWIQVIGEWDEAKEKDTTDFLKFQERQDVDREDWLGDFHPVQRRKMDNDLPEKLTSFLFDNKPILLLGTNVVGDSSILRRSTIFKNQKEWLKEIIHFIKERPELRLIIRAHPDEVWVRAKVKIGDYAFDLAKGIPNIYVIKGEEDINTYSLVQYATVGLAWVSNIGLDMVLRGKPVVMAASPKYDGLGIVNCPESREEYLNTILKYVEDSPRPSDKAIRMAKLYQRVVFKEMSLDVTSKNYNSIEYRMDKNKANPNRDKFYKILVGELDSTGQRS